MEMNHKSHRKESGKALTTKKADAVLVTQTTEEPKMTATLVER